MGAGKSMVDFRRSLKISLVIAFILASVPAVRGEDRRVPEYRLKAAVIYNILKFVSLPPDKRPGNELVLAVLGRDPFGEDLEVLRGKTVGGRTIKIVRSGNLKDLRDGHVLFIAPSEAWQITDILHSPLVRGKLTMGDTEGFAEKGVMINLVVRERKIRFQINNKAAKREGVNISSQLLRLGEIVAR